MRCSCFFFFFFSSRRRHTRLTCDWTSDVCSSDLRVMLPLVSCRLVGVTRSPCALPRAPPKASGTFTVNDDTRSEEHTSELQSHVNLVCRPLLEKQKNPCTPPWPQEAPDQPAGDPR